MWNGRSEWIPTPISQIDLDDRVLGTFWVCRDRIQFSLAPSTLACHFYASETRGAPTKDLFRARYVSEVYFLHVYVR